MQALIRNGEVVLPSGSVRADVLVQGEEVRAIGAGLEAAATAYELDASGCYVLPGRRRPARPHRH